MNKKNARKIALLLVFVFIFSFGVLAVDTQADSETVASETTQEAQGYADLNEKFSDILLQYESYCYFHPTYEDLLKNLVSGLLKEHPEMFSEIVNAMFQTTDQYSGYFTAEEYANAFYPADYVGIGVRVAQEGDYIIITEVFANSPAAMAGVEEQEKIVSVDGADVTSMTVDECGALVRGDEGTSVTLGLMDETGVVRTLTIERKAIRTDSVSYEVLTGNIGYISVRDFEDITVFFDFYNAVMDLKNTGVDGYIIDLRNNLGGDVWTALNMVNLLCGLQNNEPLATFIDYTGAEQTVDSEPTGLYLRNIVVLVNQNSYSSSEVMAGIIKDYDAATIVGVKTGGKGIGQSHIELDDGSYITITTSQITLPKTGKYHGIGIEPDVVVENGYEYNHIPNLFSMGYTKTLSEDMNDENVLGLEQRLVILGYTIKNCNPIFDAETTQAVMAFQKDNGLKQTGIANSETLKMVDEKITEFSNEQVYVDRQLDKAISIIKDEINNK